MANQLNGLYLPNIGVEVQELTQNPINETTPSFHSAKKRTLKTYFDSTQKSNSFLVMSWNVWFEDSYAQPRIYRIISIIKEKNPDFVCLQELTHETFKLIENRLSPSYQIFQAFISEDNPYGTCIMCNRNTTRIVDNEDNPYYYDYANSKMSRRVIGCEVEFTKFVAPRFHILTTHLESLAENDQAREVQFNVIKEVTKSLKNFILVGDFGIWNSNEEIEKNISRSRMKDAWIEMGCPYKAKYTYNFKKNRSVRDRSQHRFDRMYYHSSIIRPKIMGLVGRDVVSDEVKIHPSNHFGLITEFTVDQNEN